MTKIEAARQEYKDWCSAIGIDTIEKVNEVVQAGDAIPLINLCEARQERKYAEAADQIFWRRQHSSIVMISGPSSSGKTSSSLRIAQQCKVLGISPKVIELDNYFKPREQTPKDENGEYGHWQHVLTSKAAVEAATLAADPAYDSESAAQYGTWQVQKVFLHLYEENRIMIDSHAPLSFFDGADAYEVACKAYQKHESQQEFWFSVKRDDAAYAFNRFGMAAGAVPAGYAALERAVLGASRRLGLLEHSGALEAKQ